VANNYSFLFSNWLINNDLKILYWAADTAFDLMSDDVDLMIHVVFKVFKVYLYNIQKVVDS